MSLFQVKGWNVSNEIVKDDRSSKKNSKKGKQEKKPKVKPVQELVKDDNKEEVNDKKKKNKKNNKKRPREEEVEEEEDDEEEEEEEEADEIKEEDEKVKAINTKLTPLQQKMMMKLSGSRFRWINEQLYTIRSEAALKLIKEQPELFDAYHEGFRSQVQNWPENPVDVFVNEFKNRSKKPVNAPGGLPGIVDKETGDKKVVIADMGCGEAKFSKDVFQFVKKFNNNDKKFKNNKTNKFNKLKKLNTDIHSFDLKKVNDRITVADIKNVPLEDNSCSIVIFCLALMGTNFLDFLNEAYRILAPNGELWIAEIKSRFNDVKDDKKDFNQAQEFVESLKLLGFFHKKTDVNNKMFVRFEFFKPSLDILKERKEKLERRQKFIELETEKEKLMEKRQKVEEGNWLLKPCIYKRR